MFKTVDFLGLKIGALGLNEMVERVLEFALAGKGKFMTYLNANCVNISFSDTEYKKILRNANLVYAGGQGVVWAAKFLGVPIPERLNILDFFDNLVKELRERDATIYLLGGTEEVVKKTERVLRDKGLKILGSRNGFFGKTEENDIIREIRISKPNILIVGMGVPRQEKWIQEHIEELNINLCWAVGAAFDWLSSYRKRAPRWMIRYGFEWLHRLYQQPKKLWKRYLFGNTIFLCRVLKWKLKYAKII